MSPAPGSSIDGYELIRKIGEGGFGEVWLARSDATGAWKALKWIPASLHRHFAQELSALRMYVNTISSLRSPHLVPIEHVRISEQGLSYVMPLADGNEVTSPEDPAWEPLTLALILTRHREAGTWFTSEEIRTITNEILLGAQTIADAGLVHRDIKPENVLILGGRACLADFGLSTHEDSMVSLRGTPQHTAPSWYVESGGNVDQWGVAALLYVLLTGNSPDKIGRARFLWPPGGQESLTKSEQEEWRRLHQVALRATSEQPTQRFLGLGAFRTALFDEKAPPPLPPVTRPKSWVIPAAIAASLLLALTAVVGWWSSSRHPSEDPEKKYVVRLPNGRLSEPLTRAQIDELNRQYDEQQRPKQEYFKRVQAQNALIRAMQAKARDQQRTASTTKTATNSTNSTNSTKEPIANHETSTTLSHRDGARQMVALRLLLNPNEDPSRHNPDVSKMSPEELRQELAYWAVYAKLHPQNPDPWLRMPKDPLHLYKTAEELKASGEKPIWKIDQEAALAAIKKLDDPNEDPSQHHPDVSKMTRPELRFEIAYWVEYARRHPENPDPWFRYPYDPMQIYDQRPPNMSLKSYPWPDPTLTETGAPVQ